ncbi:MULTISPECIES: Abi family protein [Xanthomonas]|uniref:Abi family protein n=1 Tax=Xanthomonas TaxID=338 RepID=UPI0009BB0668|nr:MULTISPECIES: Abi family protein [Xanthomonas]ATB58020.1 Abi-like protein [Xanthomonas citri pv. fuscans]ATB59597.1 Abi-like protein [Xanthomonas citri pv. fuscans]ATS77244.1 Abi family protein [Xanthomonas citri pv. phaseoli var. fuscans]QWN08855.1 Abi family protein [Xanthomonas citri pv. fuscans]SOO08290.1 Abortive infection bacteriophage resistance protein [Xanthomonas citri pv. fuscans]
MSNPKVAFTKSAQAPQFLLAKLQAAGLIVTNQAEALTYLNFIGHYRLKGYWFHLTDPVTKDFKPGVSFDTIRDRYEFDRQLRAIVLEAVERLEVAVRTAICNHLSLKYDPFWYVNPAVFKPVASFGLGSMLSKIEGEVGRSKEKGFIESYFKKYDEPYLPPSWAMAECVTMGMWSRIYQILKDSSDKKSIAAKFGIPQVEVFESWLHTISVIRNMAAHHDRFLNNKLRVSPVNFKKKIKFADNKSVYSTLTLIHILLDASGFGPPFKKTVQNMQIRYGSGFMQELGFPNGWPAGANGW